VADTVTLRDGDRITGRVAGTTDKNYRVVTPYGRLLIPKDKIDRIVYSDGRQEVLAAPVNAEAQPVLLELVIGGDSFWHAWDPKDAPVDPSLRLLIAVDGQPVAAYVDRQLDPDIPGAVVNTFAFDPGQTSRTLWNQTRARAPEIAPGRATLRLELLPPVHGERQIILKYQMNLGVADEPVWRDLAEASLVFVAFETVPSVIHVQQSRGEMSFGGVMRKKKMRGEETFGIHLSTPTEPPPG
jgi:hypothetical protein